MSGIPSRRARSRCMPANSPLRASPQRFPMVLFLHGNGVSKFTYAAVLQEIVSHAYVVAAIEHPSSSAAVVFRRTSDLRIRSPHRRLGQSSCRSAVLEGVEIAMRDMTEIQPDESPSRWIDCGIS